MTTQEQKHPYTNMATYVKFHGLQWMSIGPESQVLAQVEGEYLFSANDESPPQKETT